jgi:hypothetical protein
MNNVHRIALLVENVYILYVTDMIGNDGFLIPKTAVFQVVSMEKISSFKNKHTIKESFDTRKA